MGLASELTRRGASTTDVMLAGNWKASRMVAHSSSGATAERGVVAQYLAAHVEAVMGWSVVRASDVLTTDWKLYTVTALWMLAW